MRTTFAIAALTSSVSAFWGTGHLLISRQAEAILTDEDQTSLDAALEMMVPLQKYYSSITDSEGNHPFTECATFADDIKGQGYSFQSDWHFINLPYYDEDGTDASDFPDFDQGDVDVTQALDACVGFLKGEVEVSGNTYLEAIANKFSYTEDQESFALRLIIHYAGDIHQPLHSVAEVDTTYPTGDRGGNSEHIPSKDGVSSLHYVWDSIIYEFTGYPDLPLSDSDWDWYTETAAGLYETYPVTLTTSGLKTGDYMGWALEGLDLAKTVVYPDFVTGEDPDEAYQAAARPVIEERLMWGARRLAETVKDIFQTRKLTRMVKELEAKAEAAFLQ